MRGSAFKKNVYTFRHRNRRPNSTLKNECPILRDIVNTLNMVTQIAITTL